MESMAYVLSSRIVCFYLVTTGWISLQYISLCEDSEKSEFRKINQSKLVPTRCIPQLSTDSNILTFVHPYYYFISLSRPSLQQAVRQNTFANSISNTNYSPWEQDIVGRHAIILCNYAVTPQLEQMHPSSRMRKTAIRGQRYYRSISSQ